MTQRDLVEAFKADLPAILAGEDPMSDADYCGRCGMHFQPMIEGKRGNQPERTICAEPRCGRWFAHMGHGSLATDVSVQPVRVYKL